MTQYTLDTYTAIHKYILEIKRTLDESNISLLSVYDVHWTQKIPLKNSVVSIVNEYRFGLLSRHEYAVLECF